jgi:hypothetical protein
MKEDKGLTAIQAFIRARSREVRWLLCTICRIDPPKYPGGPCDTCDAEAGTG